MVKNAESEHILCTQDAFFRGALTISQPLNGFRAGFDSVVLAASVPACAGEKVLELGTGPGVAALALAHRTQAQVLGVEIDTDVVALAQGNAARNGLVHLVDVQQGDATNPRTIAVRGVAHVMMNPPFYDAASSRTSPHAQKGIATHMSDDALAAWVHTAIICLKSGGSFTAIITPQWLPVVLAACAGKLGATALLPIHTIADSPASRLILHGRKGRKTPLAILPPFLTRTANGDMSETLRAIAEDGAGLPAFK